MNRFKTIFSNKITMFVAAAVESIQYAAVQESKQSLSLC